MDQLSDYDYELPEDLIAQTPLSDRSSSRLLHIERESGVFFHRHFQDVPNLLLEGDLLVMNNTRVSARRLVGKREFGGVVECLIMQQTAPNTYVALCKPAKRLKCGSKVIFGEDLLGTVQSAGQNGQRTIKFLGQDVASRIQSVSSVPLPPYIHEELSDENRYQTTYAAISGSAAAPTAGLHFTEAILEQLKVRGVEIAFVTLDVGIDTFRPVTSEALDGHIMHGEVSRLPAETAEAISSAQGRIIAVGTTTVRTLESFATGLRKVEPGEKNTKLFIRPGYSFQIIDGMFTNFHLPRTTMLMMVSALCGHATLFRTYDEAIRQKYRFLSFGDSMLVL